jgi:UDP-N-acetylmuramate--alanine ligase
MTRRAPRTPLGTNGDFRGKHLHFIGIGGCGMSGLALMLARRGAIVTGSDQSDGEAIRRLDAAGIPVRVGPAMQSLPEHTECVIFSAAIHGDHPEIRYANARSIPTMTYAEALGDAQLGSTAVSIAGTHGKSTTTAMTSWVGIRCGLDPSVIVGATCEQLGGGARLGSNAIPVGELAGKPGVLVCEACEFNRSFHHHRPTIGLINNIEEDHLDYYSSLGEIIESFREFARILPSAAHGGKLLIAEDGAHRREVTAGLDCGVATFGFSPGADYQVFYDAAANRVGIMRDGYWVAQWTNRMPGSHNALNSAAAGIINHWLGADWEDIAQALSEFGGLDRRSQELGQRNIGAGEPVRVFDDYGHHPTECEKTIRALRASEAPTRLICVFEPHQHSRTRFLLDQFASCFAQASEVIVPHIYFVRDSEVEKTRVSAQDLVDRLEAKGTKSLHIGSFEGIVAYLEENCLPGDLVLTMGAGPVNRIAKDFLRRGGARTTLTRAGEVAILGAASSHATRTSISGEAVA